MAKEKRRKIFGSRKYLFLFIYLKNRRKIGENREKLGKIGEIFLKIIFDMGKTFGTRIDRLDEEKIIYFNFFL